MSMSNFPSRGAIEQAGDLEFNEADQHSSIEIHARLGDWPVTVIFKGRINVLPAALAKLERAGLQPAAALPSAPPAAPAPARKRATTVEPVYDTAGNACCPVHNKPLRQGNYGLHCTAKDDSETSRNGYCGLKFAE